MKIHSYEKGNRIELKDAINKELNRLGTFGSFTEADIQFGGGNRRVLSLDSLSSNCHMFARLGGVQQVIMGYATMCTGYVGAPIAIVLLKGSWQGVLDKLRSIDRIELEEV